MLITISVSVEPKEIFENFYLKQIILIRFNATLHFSLSSECERSRIQT